MQRLHADSVHVVYMLLTIIGIPLAVANVKLIPVTCFPFGKAVVSRRGAQFAGLA
ncbi:hypothetical protein HMPREF9233_00702 [Actinobaculum massiliense ACS-171-V-Col2]|uniref:Inner membrane component domain-containing protein n=1 Tax=Actinobaculum massiliense ACS-171-V-Col2 TaxID=883066 RepID=K9EWK8_9ACTO|nr:hypothetical protein HMPREF9233_00702 [Actinobaculum massiliense ACS-171-V-Col2]